MSDVHGVIDIFTGNWEKQFTGGNVGSSVDNWLPPPVGWFKLNFDGSYNPCTPIAGIGGMVRETYGHLVIAFVGKVSAHHSLEGELLALQKGPSLCQSIEIFALQIGRDILVTSIQKLNSLIVGRHGTLEENNGDAHLNINLEHETLQEIC